MTKELIEKFTVGVLRSKPAARIPTRSFDTDLGYDLYLSEDEIILPPGVVTKVPTGIALQFPPLVGGLIRDRSGISTSATPVFVVAGVIDPTYRGEIIVAMFNPGPSEVVFTQGSRIAQLILLPVSLLNMREIFAFDATELDESLRGDRGFGSTGA